MKTELFSLVESTGAKAMRALKNVCLGPLAFAGLTLAASAQIGGTGWSSYTVFLVTHSILVWT